jgi:carboxymethylenebutenolidase
MRRPLLTWLAVLAFAVGAAAVPAGHSLPPAEEHAAERLNTSPRHGEFRTVDVRGAPVRVWVVYPERTDKAPVVVVIHEIFGLTDWIRAVTDQLAAEGFLAVAPDLLSGKGPHGGGTDEFPDRDDATRAISGLDRDEVLARLDAVRDWALAQPSASGSSSTVGFCWGGATSFAYAVHQPHLDAAVVYYGTPPQDVSALATVRAPVLGLYGGDDARVTSTVDATRDEMRKLGKRYDPHVFDGAGHGFLRAQSGLDGANRRAAEQAWPLTVEFLHAAPAHH